MESDSLGDSGGASSADETRCLASKQAGLATMREHLDAFIRCGYTCLDRFNGSKNNFELRMTPKKSRQH